MAGAQRVERRGDRPHHRGHGPRVVPKVRIRRAVRQSQHALHHDHLARRVRRCCLDPVHERVVADAVLDDGFRGAHALGDRGAHFVGVGVRVRVVEDRRDADVLPTVWLSTFAYSFSTPMAQITPALHGAELLAPHPASKRGAPQEVPGRRRDGVGARAGGSLRGPRSETIAIMRLITCRFAPAVPLTTLISPRSRGTSAIGVRPRITRSPLPRSFRGSGPTSNTFPARMWPQEMPGAATVSPILRAAASRRSSYARNASSASLVMDATCSAVAMWIASSDRRSGSAYPTARAITAGESVTTPMPLRASALHG